MIFLLLSLQLASFISFATATTLTEAQICTNDTLLLLFEAPVIQPKASSFCSSFLSLATQITSVVVTGTMLVKIECLSLPADVVTSTSIVSTTALATATAVETTVATSFVTTGTIQVVNQPGTEILGYISALPDGSGIYTVGSLELAMKISFTTSPGATIYTRERIYTLNDNDSFEILGVSEAPGSGNTLASGSSNYVFLCGTIGTDPGATPQPGSAATDSTGFGFSYECDIWGINVVTRVFSAEWVNPNGDSVNLPAFRDSDNSILGLTGDYAAFSAAYSNPSQKVHFKFVPS